MKIASISLVALALGALSATAARAGDPPTKTSYIRIAASEAARLDEILSMRYNNRAVISMKVMNFVNPCIDEGSLVLEIDYKDGATAAEQDQFVSQVQMALTQADRTALVASAR